MALVVLTRRLQRACSLVLRPQLLTSIANQTLSSPSPPYHFIKTFHQTLISPCFIVPLSFRFSTFNGSKYQELHDIIDFNEYIVENQEKIQLGVVELVESVHKAKNFESGDEALDFLDKSGVTPGKDVVFSAVLSLREEWKLAFLVFKWGERWNCIVEETWCLITWVLGNHRKFGTAWSVINNMHQNSMNAQQAILVMIDRYAAANLSGKAIQAFQIMEKFSLSPDQIAFFTFLNILCKHGNIEEAEECMFLNKKLFPLVTEGFNIILNGWCNIAVDVFEAKRVWREMSKCCILPNEISYSHMISCFSKVGNLFESLRLFDEMKKRGFAPGPGAYNSLIHILASENCLKEALTILEKMKELGLCRDSTTYNSMIRPLCEATKLEEARKILAMMIEDNVSPTVDTYHAFLQCATSLYGALEFLNHMKKSGLGPTGDAFLIILRKFFEKRQPESSLSIWLEMKQHDILPDSAHYAVLVEGLVKCGLLAKAREFYSEMRSKGIGNDPKLEKLLKDPELKKGDQGGTMEHKEARGLPVGRSSVSRKKRFHKNSSKKGRSGT